MTRVWKRAALIATLSAWGCASETSSGDGDSASPSGGDGDGDGEEPAPAYTGLLTSGMMADFEARAPGDGNTYIDAVLRVGGPNGTFVQLTGDDELVAMVDGEETWLDEWSTGDRYGYDGIVATDAAGTEVVIALRRSADAASAPNSRVTLPAPFVLTTTNIVDGAGWSRSEDLVLTWEPSGSEVVHWAFRGICISSAEGQTLDDGLLTIPAEAVELDLLSDEEDSCDVEITLQRSRTGSVDDAFADGRFTAIQSRTLTVSSVP